MQPVLVKRNISVCTGSTLGIIVLLLIALVFWGSVDLCQFLRGRGRERARLRSDRFLAGVLAANGAEWRTIARCLDLISALEDDLLEAIAQTEKDIPESIDSRAFLVLQHLKAPAKDLLTALGKAGLSHKKSVLFLYVAMLERLQISYSLFKENRSLSVVVDGCKVDVTSPGAGFIAGSTHTGRATSIDRAMFSNSTTTSDCTTSTSPAAGTTVEQAVRIDLSFLAATEHMSSACRAIKDKQYQQAVRLCDRAIKLIPENSIAHLNRGIALSGLSRHREALQSLDKALQIDPGFRAAHHQRGNCLYRLGRFEEAATTWQKAKILAGSDHDDRSLEAAKRNMSTLKRESEFLPLEQDVFAASLVYRADKVLEIGAAERELRKIPGISFLGPYNRAREIFTWTWQNYDFELFEESSSINDILAMNRGNCATLTTFFGLLFKRFGLEPDVMMFSNHVFLSLTIDGRRVDVETTNPDGFDTSMHVKRPGVRGFDIEVLPGILYHNAAANSLSARKLFRARHLVNESLKAFPDNALAYSLLADSYTLQGEVDKSILLREKAIIMDPYFSNLYMDQAMLYLVTGRYRLCADYLHHALYFSSFDSEPDKVVGKIGELEEKLFSRPEVKQSPEFARELRDLIELPGAVSDREIFRKYASKEFVQGVYRVDFKDNRQAYLDIRLDDLLEEPVVMVAAPDTVEFREASRSRNGAYYYPDTGSRVAIHTGTRFYVPLEKIVGE